MLLLLNCSLPNFSSFSWSWISSGSSPIGSTIASASFAQIDQRSIRHRLKSQSRIWLPQTHHRQFHPNSRIYFPWAHRSRSCHRYHRQWPGMSLATFAYWASPLYQWWRWPTLWTPSHYFRSDRLSGRFFQPERGSDRSCPSFLYRRAGGSLVRCLLGLGNLYGPYLKI